MKLNSILRSVLIINGDNVKRVLNECWKQDEMTHCHYNIHGIRGARAKKGFNNVKVDRF